MLKLIVTDQKVIFNNQFGVILTLF